MVSHTSYVGVRRFQIEACSVGPHGLEDSFGQMDSEPSVARPGFLEVVNGLCVLTPPHRPLPRAVQGAD